MAGAAPEGLGPQAPPAPDRAYLATMDRKLNVLNEKVDRLLHFQEDVTEKLQSVCRGLDRLEQGLLWLEASRVPVTTTAGWPEVLELLKAVRQDGAQHTARLEGLFGMLVALDRAVTWVGAALQSSKLVDGVVPWNVPWRKGRLAEDPEENKERVEEKGAKPKHALSPRGAQAQVRGPGEESQRAELPEAPEERAAGPGADVRPQAGASPGQGDGALSLDQEPAGPLLLPTEAAAKAPETSSENLGTGLVSSAAQDRVSEAPTSQKSAPSTGQGTLCSGTEPQLSEDGTGLTPGPGPQPPGTPAPARAAGSGGEASVRDSIQAQEADRPGEPQETQGPGGTPPSCAQAPTAAGPGERDPSGSQCWPEAAGAESAGQNPRGATAIAPLPKRSSDSGVSPEGLGGALSVATGAAGLPQDTSPGAGGRTPCGTEAAGAVLDDSPAPAAPFEHRVVSVKETPITAGYAVCQHEVLGGGRFGQVHRCTERATGLPLAAKIIRVKSAKDREDVKNEVNIMNQLSHVNLIQLYDAFESKNSFTLVMEYVDGGELFDRITDEKYHLTELDVILFTKQLCEGVRHLHQHYILHLDLKPENILCVSQTGHQIKIIDFGLARRYKPREKLKVNFGTPEFLAPEVVNYEFVSFPTDMWSVGVIAYMLLSGLSPFLGETDTETMNFIVNCSWDFDADTFEGLSEEAKDFVSRLLVKEKSCRMSATQCLKHEWLNNLPVKASKSKVRLKSQLLLQKYMAQRKWKKHFYVVTAANRLRKFPTCP